MIDTVLHAAEGPAGGGTGSAPEAAPSGSAPGPAGTATAPSLTPQSDAVASMYNDDGSVRQEQKAPTPNQSAGTEKLDADKPAADQTGQDKPKAEGEAKPEGEGEAKAGEGGEGKSEERKPTFDAKAVKLADGMEIDKSAVEAVAPVLNELGLTTEQGQKLVDKYTEIRKKEYENFRELRKNWVEEARADPEIGKANWDKSVADARKALAKFDSADGGLAEYLHITGGGDNPHVIRFLTRVGRLVQNDRPVSEEVRGSPERDAISTLYPNQ